MQEQLLNDISQNENYFNRKLINSVCLEKKLIKKLKINRTGLKFLVKDFFKTINSKNSVGSILKEKLFWEYQGDIAGYSFIYHKEKNKTLHIEFKLFDSIELPKEDIHFFLHKTLEDVFHKHSIDRVCFNEYDNSSGYITDIFLKLFQPYQIGFIHLNEGKYVLTKNKFLGKKEKFYKSKYKEYTGKNLIRHF